MKKLILHELDTVFISYDEPNADKNYAELVKIIPWAKRIHGVKGSDAAHKAAAELSETDRLITVDGDNIVDKRFFEQDFYIPEGKEDCVFSWTGCNIINGLMYGNGGLKCWPKQYILDMKTHENSSGDDPRTRVEFCFDDKYIQINSVYSMSHINASPLQAFRAGFREGVKMSLNEGEKWPIENFRFNLYQKNYHRMLVWMNVGADVKNGLYAMYGARLGCSMTMLSDWDYVQVRDFESINHIWQEELEFGLEDNLVDYLDKLAKDLREELSIPVESLSPIQSEFFKEVYRNPPRVET
jgi:hypothetical protein